MAYRLKSGEDAQAAIRRILASEAKKALEDLESAADPAHAARRRLKKIRAALRLARSGMKTDDFARENAVWREAGWLLAPPRDHMARLETVVRLREEIEDPAITAALSTLHERLMAHAPLDPDTIRVRAARAISDSMEKTRRLRVEGKAHAVFPDGLRRTYRSGGESGAAAYESGDPADFHEWRKNVKALMLQLRIIAPAAPGELGAMCASAGELGELLGEDHDLAQLAALIARHPELLDSADQRETLGARMTERSVLLRARARPVYEALYAEKPKAFGRRIESHLKAWAA